MCINANNGHSQPKRVLTFGVFDLLHIGHVSLFERARKLGGALTVAVQEDSMIKKYKPDAHVFYSTKERLYMVSSIKYVDSVVTYRDVDKDIKRIGFDILVVGPDQTHAGFQRARQWSEENGKEVIVLSRTEGVSSTEIRGIKSNH